MKNSRKSNDSHSSVMGAHCVNIMMSLLIVTFLVSGNQWLYRIGLVLVWIAISCNIVVVLLCPIIKNRRQDAQLGEKYTNANHIVATCATLFVTSALLLKGEFISFAVMSITYFMAIWSIKRTINEKE